MTHPRLSFKTGHRPKFLLLIDESEEADRALTFAARRAKRLDAELFLLAVVNSDDFAGTHLFGAANAMRQESYEAAEERLSRAQLRLKRMQVAPAEQSILEGKTAELIHKIIEQEQDVFALVLAAGTSNEGPGPLVTSLSKASGNFPIPIVIVPGHLSEEEIEALA